MPRLNGLAERLRRPGSDALAREVVEAMSTNESFFVRDHKPFHHFRTQALARPVAGRRRVRWAIVFCRNALIYFDRPTKARVLDAIARLMPPDGLLYLGGAETVLGITSRFAPMPNERGVYGIVAAAHRVAAAV